MLIDRLVLQIRIMALRVSTFSNVTQNKEIWEKI
jgi:hypothetical protein